jgi:hypothetical protein
VISQWQCLTASIVRAGHLERASASVRSVFPLIKSKRAGSEEWLHHVEWYRSEATAELKASYDAVVKRIENMPFSPAETKWDGASFDGRTASKAMI